MKVLLILTAALAFTATTAFASDFPAPPREPSVSATGPQTAVLAGGCFWGMEGIFEKLKGVTDVTSGYSGGEANTAQYEMVSSGSTGHAESVRITYDPKQVSYGTLLKVYFSIAHNPTELNFQGPDRGTQYRSVIFYATPMQKQVADDYISSLDAARVFPKRIVTQVVPLKAFYPAEEYHQKFMEKNPNFPYIVYWDKPRVARLEQMYPELLASR